MKADAILAPRRPTGRTPTSLPAATSNVVQLRLVRSAPVSPEAVEMVASLEALLEGVKDGHVVGIAFAAILHGPKRCFIANVKGACEEQLTYTRGILASLSDHLGYLTRQRDVSDVR